MTAQRLPNTSAAAAAAEEVHTAVNKLHAEVEDLKAQKAALLKHTTTAAKAATIAAKQQQQAPSKRSSSSSRKRSAATAALSDGDNSSASGEPSDDDAAAAVARHSSRQGSSKTLEQVCGPTWRLFQALALQSLPEAAAGTRPAAMAQEVSQPAAVMPAAAGEAHAAEAAAPAAEGGMPVLGDAPPAAAPEQQSDPVLSSSNRAVPVPADPTVPLQQLVQSCLQQLATGSGTASSGPTFAAVSEALSSTAPRSSTGCAGASSRPAQPLLFDEQLLPDLDGLVLTDRAPAAPAGTAAAAPTDLHAAAAACPPLPPSQHPFCMSELLQQFDSLHASPDSQQQQRQPADTAGLIAGRFMLLSTAAADPLCSSTPGGLSQHSAQHSAAGHIQQQQLIDAGEVGLPSYMQRVIQRPPAQVGPCKPGAAGASKPPVPVAASKLHSAAVAAGNTHSAGAAAAHTATDVSVSPPAAVPVCSGPQQLQEPPPLGQLGLLLADHSCSPCAPPPRLLLQPPATELTPQQVQAQAQAAAVQQSREQDQAAAAEMSMWLEQAGLGPGGLDDTDLQVFGLEDGDPVSSQHPVTSNADGVPGQPPLAGLDGQARGSQHSTGGQQHPEHSQGWDKLAEAADCPAAAAGAEGVRCTTTEAAAAFGSQGEDSQVPGMAAAMDLDGLDADGLDVLLEAPDSLLGVTADVAPADAAAAMRLAAAAAAAGAGAAVQEQRLGQPQQHQETEQVQHQQQQEQQQEGSKVRSSYVPRFTKRKQNYCLLVDSLQQQQQLPGGTATADANTAATAADGTPADGADSDGCVFEDPFEGSDGGCDVRRSAAKTAAAMPQLSRRRLSTSIAAAAPTDVSQPDAPNTAAAFAGDSSSTKWRVLPLLRRRGGLSQQQPGLSSQGAGYGCEGAAAAAAAGNGSSSGSEKDDAIEDSGSGSDQDVRQQQQQQLAAAAGDAGTVGTGYRGAVPSLGRRRAARPPTSSQGAPRLNNSSSSSQRRKSTGGSSQHCSDDGTPSSIWGASSDDLAGADSSDGGGEECESDAFECHTPAAGRRPRTGVQPGSQSQGTALKGRCATAAAAVAASKPAGPLLLLQPSFRHATAWQYSSSNLLRLSQGCGKRRFKPVVKPEALLKPPAVTLKQLGHSMHAQQSQQQQLQVPPHSTAATVLKALLGADHFQQHFGTAPQQQQQQQWPGPQQQMNSAAWGRVPAGVGLSAAAENAATAAAAPPGASAAGPDAAVCAADEFSEDFDDFDWEAVDAIEAQHSTAGHAAAQAAPPVAAAAADQAVGTGPAPAAAATAAAAGSEIITALADLRQQQQQAQPWQQHQRQAQAQPWQHHPQQQCQPSVRQQQQQGPLWHQQQQQQQQPVSSWSGQQQVAGSAGKPASGHPTRQAQQQQHQQQDPITTALAGLLGFSSDEEGEAAAEGAAAGAAAAAAAGLLLPPGPDTPAIADAAPGAVRPAAPPSTSAATAAQRQQQQGPAQAGQEGAELVITGLFDSCAGQQQQQQQPLPYWQGQQQQQQHWQGQQQQQNWQGQQHQQHWGAWTGTPAPANPAAVWPPAQQQQQQQQGRFEGQQQQQQWPWGQQAGRVQPPVHSTGIQQQQQQQPAWQQQGAGWCQGNAQQQQQQQHLWAGQQQHRLQADQQQQQQHEDPSSQLLGQLLEGWDDEDGDAEQLGGGGIHVVMDEGDSMQGMEVCMDVDVHGLHMPPAEAAAGGWGLQPPHAGLQADPFSAAVVTGSQQYTHSQAQAAAAAGFIGSAAALLSTQQQQQQQQGLCDIPAGPSQLQQLHDELEDLACQLVFLDECDAAAAADAAAPAAADGNAAAAAIAADGGGVILGYSGDGDPAISAGTAKGKPGSAADGPAGLQQGVAATGVQGSVLLSGSDMQEGSTQGRETGSQGGPDAQQQQQQQHVQGCGDPGASSAAAAAAAADGAGGVSGRDHSRFRFGGGGGLGGRLAAASSSLAHMQSAERAAWVAAAKQRQQQLYGRFIELALQGQQAAAVGGHLGLQQLMGLVRQCIREELQHDGSSSNRALDVMALIRCVQGRHQQLLKQQQGQSGKTPVLEESSSEGDGLCLLAADGAKEGRSVGVDGVACTQEQQLGSSTAATAAGMGTDSSGSGAAASVAQQRLFVAFLNVAHQNNLAAAAAAAGGGDAPGDEEATGGAEGPQGRGQKRWHAGGLVGHGGGQQQPGVLAASLAPGTKIFLK